MVTSKQRPCSAGTVQGIKQGRSVLRPEDGGQAGAQAGWGWEGAVTLQGRRDLALFLRPLPPDLLFTPKLSHACPAGHSGAAGAQTLLPGFLDSNPSTSTNSNETQRRRKAMVIAQSLAANPETSPRSDSLTEFSQP